MTATSTPAPETTPSRRPSRRSLVKGASWAVPAALTVTAAPAVAASSPCEATLVSASGGSSDGATATMAGVVGGSTYTVRITSVLGTNTRTTPCAASPAYTALPRGTNLLFTGQGVDGSPSANDGSSDTVLRWGGGRTLVLNQVGVPSGGNGCIRTPGGVPSQTLTFSFTGPGGARIDPVNLRIEVADISSGDRSSTGRVRTGTTEWRDRYYDAVGFSIAPTAISSTHPGTGDGTTGSLFRRSSPDVPTPTSGGPIVDTFTFASAPSGKFTMTYTQPPNGSTGGDGNNKGWQFIGITRISFDVPC